MLIDLGLPGRDGYEVARAIRSALGAKVRLIALSGYGQPDDQRRARLAGFDTHLTKPAEIEAIDRALRPAV
jgi:CheY-like chemotaxis protein